MSQEPRCARAGWREYGRSDGYRQIMSFCVQRWQDGSFLSQRRLERMHEIHALPRCTAPTVGVAAAAVTVVAAVVFAVNSMEKLRKTADDVQIGILGQSL